MEMLRTPDERFANLPGYPFAPHYVEVGRPAHPLRRRGSARRRAGAAAARRAVVVVPLSQDDSGAHRGRASRRRAGPRRLRPLRQAGAPRGLHLPAPRRLDARRASSGSTCAASRWSARTGAASSACASPPSTRIASRASSPRTPSCRPATRRPARRSSRGASSRRRRPSSTSAASCAAAAPPTLAPEVVAAYDAPFPDESLQGRGAAVSDARADLAGRSGRARRTARRGRCCARWEKPFLTAFSDGDPITRGGDAPLPAAIPGANGQPHTTIAGGGHFLQEDKGEELAQVVVDFIARSR